MNKTFTELTDEAINNYYQETKDYELHLFYKGIIQTLIDAGKDELAKLEKYETWIDNLNILFEISQDIEQLKLNIARLEGALGK